ncbi:hypothetical protein P4S72_27805 [Vibrio sp. PP-XX7]
MNIFHQDPVVDNIRNNWRNQVMLVRPQLDSARSREIGISKQDLDAALLRNFNGENIGVYRDGSHLHSDYCSSTGSGAKNANSLSEPSRSAGF